MILTIGVMLLALAGLFRCGENAKTQKNITKTEYYDEAPGLSQGKSAPPSPTGEGSENTIPPGDADTNGDGKVDTAERDAWVKGLSNGTRGGEGDLVLSSYGQVNDSTPDKNTTEGRGAWNNRLSPGSVALSPSIVNTYHPQRGASVYVNGNFVGYYEDHTPDSYNGQSYGNTIDVYDPHNQLGSVLKTSKNGSYNITFGATRTQISNP